MPTYEFRCPNGHEFEQFYSRISLAPSTVECPTCGKVSEKLMSAGAGLVFKGSGFYITDYGKDGKKDQKTAASGKSDNAATGDATAGSANDAKPAGESKASDASAAASAAKPATESKPAAAESKPAKTAESPARKGPPKSSGGDA